MALRLSISAFQLPVPVGNAGDRYANSAAAALIPRILPTQIRRAPYPNQPGSSCTQERKIKHPRFGPFPDREYEKKDGGMIGWGAQLRQLSSTQGPH